MAQEAACATPTESYLVMACTDDEGNYELTAPEGVDAGDTVTLKVVKDAWSLTVTITVGEAASEDLVFSADTGAGAAKIAVVKGYYDSIENVLAKMGMGELNTSGALVTGTESFDLYDSPAPLFEAAGTGLKIDEYDIVYVNCGASEPTATDWQSSIMNYVNNGGRLYATDLASPYITKPFAEHLFRLASGPGGISMEGEVKNESLAQWLVGVGCKDGACIKVGHKVDLEGFAGGWHLLNPKDTTEGGGVETLVEADVSAHVTVDTPVQPLTMRFLYGDGVVVYSSYHTAASYIGSAYLPQERILEYLFHHAKD